MKETNLNLFYQLGQALHALDAVIKIDVKAFDIFSELILAETALLSFITETEDYKFQLADTRAAAQQMLDAINGIMHSVQVDLLRVLSQSEVRLFFDSKIGLENGFERERRNLSVFTVTPKGILDTRLLVEKAELKFGENTRSVFTDRVVYDLRQAGRCLAFEVPTAMAFHIMRATETLIKSYYEVLAGKLWPYNQRDWGMYISELEKFPDVNKGITTRLTEIKKFNRNPLIHPEDIVPMDEAPAIFDLCNGVIYFMAEEVRNKRKP